MPSGRIIEGSPDGKNIRLALIVARFNEEVTARLLEGALAEARALGVHQDRITILRVPGAFEIPLVVKRLCDANKVDAIACLGAVIRGETAHFEYVCEAAVGGIAALGREYGLPITNGILTCDNDDQAVERSGGKEGNSGAFAVRAAVEMADLFKRLSD
jgi:6,7-dimethyl-8-ribityllumazine synthase